jgi:uncharacterized protein YdeI (YjbR/CyaY-like superfamily)
MKPTHFAAAAEFRRWLEKNHATATELWIRFHKKASGKPGMVYSEALDEALCFGWIDGLLKGVDADSYMQRFTPRKPRSNWSKINVAHVKRLTAAGKMHPSGLAAYSAREPARTGVYSFERTEPPQLPAVFEKKFRANKQAWAFFTTQPPGYRRLAIHRVISPKQEATRERWLNRLIEESAAGRKLDAMMTASKRST